MPHLLGICALKRPARDRGRASVAGSDPQRSHCSTIFVQTGCEALLERIAIPEGTEILALPPDVFASAAHTESPQGIAALVQPPAFTLEQVLSGTRSAAADRRRLAGSRQSRDPHPFRRGLRRDRLHHSPGNREHRQPEDPPRLRGFDFRLPGITVCEDHLFHALGQRKIKTLAAVASKGEPFSRGHDLRQPCADHPRHSRRRTSAPEIPRVADARVPPSPRPASNP